MLKMIQCKFCSDSYWETKIAEKKRKEMQTINKIKSG